MMRIGGALLAVALVAACAPSAGPEPFSARRFNGTWRTSQRLRARASRPAGRPRPVMTSTAPAGTQMASIPARFSRAAGVTMALAGPAPSAPGFPFGGAWRAAMPVSFLAYYALPRPAPAAESQHFTPAPPEIR